MVSGSRFTPPSRFSDPSPETETVTGASDQDPLQETTAPQIYDAILAAMLTLSAPSTMSALQRTSAMRWRAEMQLRSALAAEQQLSAHSSSTFKSLGTYAALGSGLGLAAAGYGALAAARGITKLGWPATALVRAGGFGSSHMSPQATLAALAASESDETDMFSVGPEEQRRMRKRDTAFKMLGNALWYARWSSGLDGASEDAVGKAAKLDAESAAVKADVKLTAPPVPPKTGMPLFPVKAAATTAISGTSEQQDETAQSGSHSVQDSAANADAERAKSELLPPPPRASASKAMAQLASLGVAAGRSALANAEKQVDAAAGASTRSLPSSMRPASGSSSSSRSCSKDEELETEALQRAEREYAERIGQGCNELAKMTVCRICVDTGTTREETSSSSTPGLSRSGTIKAAADQEQTAQDRRAQNASTNTIKAAEPRQDQLPASIQWVPGRFEGEALLGSASDVPVGDASSYVRFVGGTFKVDCPTPEEALRCVELLRTGVSSIQPALRKVHELKTHHLILADTRCLQGSAGHGLPC